MRAEELIAYGKKLKKIRQEKKLDLKKISDQTKINSDYLKKIEEGKFDFLPDLYVRSFLKIYLQQLGEDVASLLGEYDSFQSEEQLKVRIVTDEDLKDIKKHSHFRSQISTIIEKVKPYIRQMNIIWLLGGAIIIFLVIYSLSRKERNQPIISAGSTGKSLIEHQKVLLDTIASSPYATNIFNKDKELNLQLKALERTWLQISVDDSVAQEHIFDGGTTFNWHAKEKFRLRIGNAAGIRLILNGNDLGLLGKSGQVIRFDLTEEGIQNRFL